MLLKKFFLLTLLSAWFSLSGLSQLSDKQKTIYDQSWKLVEITGDNASYYSGMADSCSFFIAQDGVVGRYCQSANEFYTTCCWERKGKKKFVFSDAVELEKCRVILWSDDEIILEPIEEKGTHLHFKK